jgi:hypothetical protein
MPEHTDARFRELLSRLDEIAEESRWIRERIRSVRARQPEWPDRSNVSEMFDRDPAEYHSSSPRRDEDEK